MSLVGYIEKCLGLWPEKISMKGSRYIPQSNGYLFPELIKIHDKLQDNSKEYIDGVIMYEVYRLFFRKMKENYNKNLSIKAHKSDFDIEQLAENVRKEIMKRGDDEELKLSLKAIDN